MSKKSIRRRAIDELKVNREIRLSTVAAAADQNSIFDDRLLEAVDDVEKAKRSFSGPFYGPDCIKNANAAADKLGNAYKKQHRRAMDAKLARPPKD